VPSISSKPTLSEDPTTSHQFPVIHRYTQRPLIVGEDMAPKELNFITGNKHKLAEVQAILSSTGVELKSQAIDLPELQGTIEDISKDKARRAADVVRFHHTLQVVEMTGMETKG
jgi:hypothetical protein